MSIGLIVSFGYVHFYPATYTNYYIQSIKIHFFNYDRSLLNFLKRSLTSDSWKKSLIESANFDQNSYNQALIAISSAALSEPDGYLEISISSKKKDLEKADELLTKLSKHILKILGLSKILRLKINLPLALL